jgi:transcription initiation factor TFIID subunit 13
LHYSQEAPTNRDPVGEIIDAETRANDDVEIDLKKSKKGLLIKDIKYMMYGFGDVEEPLDESADLVEDMLLEYLENFANRAMECAERRGSLKTEDLLYIIRHDEKKTARVNELLRINEEIKEARKNFELDEAANVAPPEKVKDADNEDDEQ